MACILYFSSTNGQIGVDLSDIWVSGVPLAVLGRSLGGRGLACPMSIFDRFGVAFGGPSGSLLGSFWYHMSKMYPFEVIVGDISGF